MQLLSIAVALVALGFTYRLSRSKRGAERYGIVLVMLPLALVTPLIALMASGLQLIYAFRGAASTEGLEALASGVSGAADTQYVGHLTLLALLGALALVAMLLLVLRQASADEAPEPTDDAPSEPKATSKYASPLMAVAVLVCIAAVATLAEFEDRFVASPLAFVAAFDSSDVSEYSSNQRAVDDQRRRGTNALVIETFRTLVVVVLFLVLFDAFLVGSRTATFTRGTLLVSIVLIGLASAVSFRAFSHQRSFRQTIEDRLSAAAKTRAEALEASEEAEGATEESEPPDSPEIPD